MDRRKHFKPSAVPTDHVQFFFCGHMPFSSLEKLINFAQTVAGAPIVESFQLKGTGSIISFATIEQASRVQKELDNIPCSVEGCPCSSRAIFQLKKAKTKFDPMMSWRNQCRSDQPPPIDGLILIKEFITEQEEMELMQAIDGAGWVDVLRRRVQHYGYAFNYLRKLIDKDKKMPILPEIAALMHRVSSDARTLCTVELDQATVNEYLPGTGIASHVDTHSAFGDEIISLSLGTGCIMEFTQKDPTTHEELKHETVWLPRRSLAVMRGESRYAWEHAIPRREKDFVDGAVVKRARRVSITMRKVNHGECSCKWPEYCDSQQSLLPAGKSGGPELEQELVHKFYDAIAVHFDKTRHTPWPGVETFLNDLPPGCLIADIGCGNGRNMGLSPQSFVLGMDNCDALVGLSQQKGFHVCRADAMNIPYRKNCFDVVMLIAVLHHISTDERRMQVLLGTIELMRVGGQALVYVWAQEQGEESRVIAAFERQDVLIPWKLPKDDGTDDTVVIRRYCHMFHKGELEELCLRTGLVEVVHSCWEFSNWCVVLRRIK